MGRHDRLHLEGEISEVLAGGRVRVRCEIGHEVLAEFTGRSRKQKAQLGDKVTVAVSGEEPSRGLIVRRGPVD